MARSIFTNIKQVVWRERIEVGVRATSQENTPPGMRQCSSFISVQVARVPVHWTFKFFQRVRRREPCGTSTSGEMSVASEEFIYKYQPDTYRPVGTPPTLRWSNLELWAPPNCKLPTGNRFYPVAKVKIIQITRRKLVESVLRTFTPLRKVHWIHKFQSL